MSNNKLKYLQYQETLKKQFGERISHNEATILTYLFYKVKCNDDLDSFINIDDADISDYFENYDLKKFYIETTKNINQDVFLFSSIIKNNDINVLKEYLNNQIKEYFYSIYRKKEKKSLEDLLEQILDLKDGQNVLYCYEDSFELLERIIQKKNINTTILLLNNETRFSDITSEKYLYLKIYFEINSKNIEILYKKTINDTYDRIFVDIFPQTYLNKDKIEKTIREKLNEKGLAVRLMQDQLLDTLEEDVRNEREKDLDVGILKSVISIPKRINTFGSSLMARATIVIYSKDKKHESCLFVDASNECENDNRFSWFSEKNIISIIKTIEDKKSDISKKISYETIRNNEASFSPYYYIKNDGNLKEAIELEKVAKIFRGNDLVRIRSRINGCVNENETYEYRSLAAADLDEENIDYKNLPKVNIDKNIDSFILESGDILINKNGTRLRTNIYENDKTLKVIPDGNIIIIRPDREKINSIYLKTYLDSENGNKDLLNIAQSGAIIRSINVSRLKKLSVPCPNKEEQDEFEKKYLEKKEMLNKINKEIKDLSINYFNK